MPAEAMSVPGTLYLYQDRVRIVAGAHQALHPRLWEPGARSILPEHRSSAVAAVSGKRARRYLKREHLLQVGVEAQEYLTEVVHRRPRIWTVDVEALHELLQTHGDAAFRVALRRALADGLYGAEYVRHYLTEAPISQGTPA
jgi:hypothetical protein